MSQSKLPIKFQELLQLQQYGIGQQSISFAYLTMESERFICVREHIGDQKNVVIVDMNNPSALLRKPISADATIMNPTENILALAADQQLQVFNLEKRSKIKEFRMPQPVVFWKWITDNIIAIVTSSAVYHWDMNGADAPTKVFERVQQLSDCQIINYKADASKNWLVLIGIAQREGQIVGCAQLHSMEKKVSQFIEAHAAAFCQYTMEGASKPSTLFVFAQKTAAASKLFILEVTKGDEDKTFPKTAVDIFFPPDAVGDFPVAVQISEKYDMIFLLTKLGYLHLFYLGNGSLIFRNRISSDTIFLSTFQKSTDGVIAINRKGQVLSISIDEQNIVQYIMSTLDDVSLARKIAGKHNLPGADDLFKAEFSKYFNSGMLKEAAMIAAQSSGTAIRNLQTLQALQRMPTTPGSPAPLLVYLGTLLEHTKLNAVESLELARVVIQQNKLPVLEKWIQEDKLECSEQLGDEIRKQDLRLALTVYAHANACSKVVQILAETGQYEKIVPYAQKANYKPDYMSILLQIIPVSPERAKGFASSLLQQGGNLVDINQVIEAFMRYKLIQDITSILLDVLKGDKPEEGHLQTKLLEINLINAPQVAEAMLSNEMFSHYDRHRIGQLCEQAGLYQRALAHYTEPQDIRRVIVHTHAIPVDFLVKYFGTLSVEDTMEILGEYMRTNLRQNMPIVVQVASKYWEELTPQALIKLFEQFKSYEGLYYFLSQIINQSTDPEVHFKYLEAAAKTGQFAEVERICRESDSFEPERVIAFLKEAKLQDQLPLIIVCDRFDFVEDLTTYLYQNNLNKFIEAYVQKINPPNTPMVVGALLDCGCNEEYVRNLVQTVRGLCPVEPLVKAVSERNRLKLILPWLEEREKEGNNEPALHNALAKIYVDIGRNSEEFLTNNPHYDSLEVGKYCEDRDPYLAFVAYKRGQCDTQLIEVTNAHALFKCQASYLVERQDLDLWAAVLDKGNKYRPSVVDQVVHSVLPETKSADTISTTVRAFMNADLPSELIELLEKIVLEGGAGSEFGQHKSLQNLLILTAVGADSSRVMNYLERLNNFDGPDVAAICISSNLFEEAFFAYKKFGHNVEAIGVLLDHMQELDRGKEFAEKVGQPEVFSKLGQAQLNAGYVSLAVDSFLKAKDHEFYAEVIEEARKANAYSDLVRFLLMCRKKIKEPKIESELLFAYAKTDKLSDLEEFINTPNCAQIQMIGDRCFEEGLYEAARLLYNNINNFVKLASTLIHLKQYNAAVDAARKANSTKTWKEVNLACVDAQEFRLAQICGVHIIIHGDELSDLIVNYERRGYFEEVIALLESGLALERAHTGMFTELAILYSKYKEEKLMEHLKLYSEKMQVNKVLRVCHNNQQWKEITFLCMANDPDRALETMMDHSPDAWDPLNFKDAILRAKLDLVYKGIEFYINEQPKRVLELLQTVVNRVDHSVVVERVRRKKHLPLIKQYLLQVQDQNIPSVNEAVNELLVEEGEHEALRKSISTHTNFDLLGLARAIEHHTLLEFRRIAASLYTIAKKYEKALELCKADNMYKDAINIAAESGDTEIAEELLRFFVRTNNRAGYTATLYNCYDLIRPDLALECGWRDGLMEFTFPFLVQSFRTRTEKIQSLESRLAKLEAAHKARDEKEQSGSGFDQPIQSDLPSSLYGVPALPMAPSMAQPPGYGAQMPPGGAFGMGPVGMGMGGMPFGGTSPTTTGSSSTQMGGMGGFGGIQSL